MYDNLSRVKHSSILSFWQALRALGEGLRTRAYDNPVDREIGFFDVETRCLHWCPITTFQMGKQEFHQNPEAFADLGLDQETFRAVSDKFRTPTGRKELFGVPMLVKTPEGWRDEP